MSATIIATPLTPMISFAFKMSSRRGSVFAVDVGSSVGRVAKYDVLFFSISRGRQGIHASGSAIGEGSSVRRFSSIVSGIADSGFFCFLFFVFFCS